MLELLLCSLLTIFPDYLYRRYRQGKRIGKEITLFSVWFELRWGIVSCLMLTVALITVIFYYHPTTSSVTAFFRTVPITSEKNGRVAEIYASLSDHVEKGEPIFRLDSSAQDADLEFEHRRIAETDAAMEVAEEVLSSGSEQAMEPMLAPDRKVVHDTVGEIEGVETRSEGEEPRRYVVVSPLRTSAELDSDTDD